MFRGMPFGCLSLFLFIGILILLPFFLADVMAGAMVKLGLSRSLSLAIVFGIFVGGLINIPLKRIPRVMSIETEPLALFGVRRMVPGWMRRTSSTIIAVNVGGCLIPSALAVYEFLRIASHGPTALMLAALAVGINIAVCYRLARPVPNVGIVLPAPIPALVAAACGLLFMRELAPPVAFTAGVLGPLIGADLLNLRRIERVSTGMASIGGAGTFDGIVLSGLVATLLA